MQNIHLTLSFGITILQWLVYNTNNNNINNRNQYGDTYYAFHLYDSLHSLSRQWVMYANILYGVINQIEGHY